MSSLSLHVVFSAPSGFNTRELLLPLKELLEQDEQIKRVTVISPAAAWHTTLFAEYSAKFTFVPNPTSAAAHEQLLRELQPNLVVTPTTGLDTYDVPILQAAQALHIPTLTFVASWDNVYKMAKAKARQLPYVVPTHIVVWNTMMRDHVLNIYPSLQSQQVSVIGSPRLDFFQQADRIPSATELRTYLGLPSDNLPLVHLATTELYSLDYVVKAIWQAQQANKLPAMHLYASVHPGGDLARHQAYAQKYGITARFSFGRLEHSPVPEFLYNPSLADIRMLVALFTHSQLLINHSSTVALESILGGVPVVNVAYGRPFDWFTWYRSSVYRDFQEHYATIINSHATTVVHSPRELITSMNTLLQHPRQHQAAGQKLIKQMITTTDGTAGRRLLDKIKSVATVAGT